VSLIKSVSTVSLLTLVSRITGLLREILVVSFFGVSAMTDAFNVAFRIPNFFRRMFAEGAFSQVFVPTLAASKAKYGEAQTKLLIDRVGTVLLWVLVLICVAGVLAAPAMVWLMASGLQQNPKGYATAVVMTQYIFPYIGFMSLVAFSSGILNTWRHFGVSAATPVLLNVAMIAAAWWLAPWFKTLGIEPIYALCVGVMVGGVLQLAVQIPALWRIGLLPRFALRWSGIRAAFQDPSTRHLAKMMVPALFGVSVAQISLLINTQIASHLPVGSVSWLNASDRLMEFPTAMLGVALGVVLVPQLSAAKASEDALRYSSLLDWGLRLVVLLAVPCALGILLFAQPLVAVLYHYGAFTGWDVQQTALSLMGWGIGLVGVVAIKVLAPGYYARQDIKTPVKIAVVVLVLTQLMNLAFVPLFKHAGLSLSIGLGASVNAIWLLLGLVRQGAYKPEKGWGRFALQVTVASMVLALYLAWAAQAFSWIELGRHPVQRVAWMALLLLGAVSVYLGAVSVLGLRLKALLRR
jgi:putative peptidoglycan lipid II flippase